MNVDDNPDLDMTEQEFEERLGRAAAVTVVANAGGGVAGGDSATNRYVVTNTEPSIARSDDSRTQALLQQ